MLVNAHILGSTPEAVKKRRVRVARAPSPAWTLSSDGKLPPLPENSFRRMFGPHGDANWLEPPNVKGRGRGRRATHSYRSGPYNIPMPVPPEIKGQKYIDLATLRKNGSAVHTPVWFGEKDDKLYVMTRSDSGKYKRIRNNARIRIAPCTIRGKITGPDFAANARVLPPEDWPWAGKTIKGKYWLARIPFFWSKQNVYMEIEITA